MIYGDLPIKIMMLIFQFATFNNQRVTVLHDEMLKLQLFSQGFYRKTGQLKLGGFSGRPLAS